MYHRAVQSTRMYFLSLVGICSGKPFHRSSLLSNLRTLCIRGTLKCIPAPSVTPIPYRIMVPRPITNLLCPGRAVSVERHVLGPLRVMAPAMAMGEAAGQATIQVVERQIAFRDVDTDVLRAELRQHGAIVDWGQKI